ncbi:MAG: glycosyltransferase family 2 protein [Bacteroidetes bacterium]|nr:MAG: glycosyltransferase family 2 protein [Bacteroidota bacterium]
MSEQLRLSVIIPCYNEEDVIATTFDRLMGVINANGYHTNYEVIFIDDGSRDSTLSILEERAATNPNIKLLSFSRNFGHQPAVCAGICEATGDVAIIIDADLQDPPELFPDIIAKYKETQANVVYCVRQNREGVGFFKKLAYKGFYRTVNYLSEVDLPLDSGDFRLIDRHVIDAFKQFREKNKYVRGIISWMGFSQTPFYYNRPGRAGGETKYSLRKLLHLASIGMFYFSKKPLKLALNLGLVSILIGLILTTVVVVEKVSGDLEEVPGWASLIITIIFFGGVQLITVGVLGEYIGNIFDEVKDRPEYIVKKKVNV